MKSNHNFPAKVLLLLLAVGLAAAAPAQVSEGGTPPSFAYAARGVSQAQIIPLVGLKARVDVRVDFDVAALKREDAEREANGAPPRIARVVPVHLNSDSVGEWTSLPDGRRIWRLAISARGALGIILTYERFSLPRGGRLYLYNAEQSEVLGAYTSGTNAKGEEFATEMVSGESVTLEYVEPVRSGDALAPKGELRPSIVVSGVGYVYNHVTVEREGAGGGAHARIVWAAQPCEVNVNCSEGASWQNQKKGVARIILIEDGSYYLCSGTVVNNTAGNLDPLFLSAFHCFGESSASDLNRALFYFNYESAGCSSPAGYDPDPYNTYTVTGATMLVESPLDGGSDGALLRLNQNIPASFNVYYNGWDRRNVPATSGVGIHHPNGAIKKISTFTSPVTSATARMSGGETGLTDAHWRVDFVQTENGFGVTEGGSSGSPLFDQNKRVVGTLTGGTDDCNNTSGYSIYGKLWAHYDLADEASRRMAKYLDPLNNGAEWVDGTYYVTSDTAIAAFLPSATEVYASGSVQFNDASVLATTWRWTFEGGIPSAYTGQTPPAVTYNTVGDYRATLLINEGQAGNERSTSTVIRVRHKQTQCSEYKSVGGDMLRAQASAFPLGAQSYVTFSAAIYTLEELGLPRNDAGGTVSKVAWNATRATTQGCKLWIYLKETEDSTYSAPRRWDDEPKVHLDSIAAYESSYTESTVAGWNSYTLTHPFSYSGKRNIEVMVVSSVPYRPAAGFENAGCLYTPKAGSHQQWTSDDGNVPDTLGTINSHRPNIRMAVDYACGYEAPVANFAIDGAGAVLSEDFDGAAWPPKQWSVHVAGASGQSWMPYAVGHGGPQDKSAVIYYDDVNEVNSWLYTQWTMLPAGAKLEFEAYYGRQWFTDDMLTFYIRTSDSKDWVKLWGNSEVSSYAWRTFSFDLSAYAGRNVSFAWQYRGVGGDVAAIDGVKVYTPQQSCTIGEGEQVRFIDYSAGPPVQWLWELPGSEEKESSLSSPTATYNTAGVYDVKLRIVNGLGTSEKRGKITVNTPRVLPPKADFLSDSYGFRTYPNSGQYIAPKDGGSVYFLDLSENNPTRRRWTLPGIDSASATRNATRQSMEVSYVEGEGLYDATLEVSNAQGSDVKTRAGEVKVGGAPQEVWNVYSNETATTLYGEDGYPYFAPGIFFTAVSERFESTAPCVVQKVKVYTAMLGRGAARVVVSLYTDNGGVPGRAIATSQPVPAVAGGYTEVPFGSAVGVPAAFHVVLTRSGSGDAASNFYCVPSTPSRTSAYNTTCIKYGPYGWITATMLMSYYVSLNVVPTVQYTTLSVASDSVIKTSNAGEASDTIAFSTNASTWTAASSDTWLHIGSAGGPTSAGGNKLAVRCDENPYSMRSGVVAVTTGGATRSFVVVQAGTGPRNLKAEYSKAARAAVLSWEHRLPSYLPGDDIFESAEKLPNFATLSDTSWQYPWLFYDGDGQPTFRAGTEEYDKASAPKSFMVFATDGAGVALSDAQRPLYTPHNGNRCFISFASSTGEHYPTADYLISPPLSLQKDGMVSLWAKSGSPLPAAEGARLRVAYSTTGTDALDFEHNLTSGGNAGEVVPMHWIKLELPLPREAKYVAIISQTPGGKNYALLVDDIYIGTGIAPRSDSAAAAGAQQPVVVVEDSAPAVALPPRIVNRAANRSLTPIQQHRLSTLGFVGDDMWLRQGTVTPAADSVAPASPRAAEANSKEKVLRWDDGSGTLNGSIGLASGEDVGFGIRFAPADLVLFKGAKLCAVEVFPVELNQGMRIEVFEDGQSLYAQTVPAAMLTTGRVNRISLDREVVVSGAKELLVACYLRRAGYDKGPAVAGKGDLLDGGTGAWTSAATMGYNYNFIMAAYAMPADVRVQYNIYREQQPAATLVDGRTYTDTAAARGASACYAVSATYDGDPKLETAPTGTACLFIKAHITLTVDSARRMEAEPNPPFTAHAAGQLLGADNDSTILAHVAFSTSANITSPAGTYLLSAVVPEANALHDRYSFLSVADSLRVGATPTTIVRQPANTALCITDSAPAVGLSLDAHGLDIAYRWERLAERDSTWHLVRETYASGRQSEGQLVLDPVSVADAGTYRVHVKGRSTEAYSDTVTLRINLPTDRLVALQWDNVLTVNNTAATNGGHNFVAYQWLRNGQPIAGATKQYLQVPRGGDGATYTCELKTAREQPLGLCPFTWNGSEVPQAIALYPNPATPGGSVQLTLTTAAPEGSEINLYALTGERLRAPQPLQGRTAAISLQGIPQGVYLLQVKPKGSAAQVAKLVIQ